MRNIEAGPGAISRASRAVRGALMDLDMPTGRRLRTIGGASGLTVVGASAVYGGIEAAPHLSQLVVGVTGMPGALDALPPTIGFAALPACVLIFPTLFPPGESALGSHGAHAARTGLARIAACSTLVAGSGAVVTGISALAGGGSLMRTSLEVSAAAATTAATMALGAVRYRRWADISLPG